MQASSKQKALTGIRLSQALTMIAGFEKPRLIAKALVRDHEEFFSSRDISEEQILRAVRYIKHHPNASKLRNEVAIRRKDWRQASQEVPIANLRYRLQVFQNQHDRLLESLGSAETIRELLEVEVQLRETVKAVREEVQGLMDTGTSDNSASFPGQLTLTDIELSVVKYLDGEKDLCSD